MPKYGSIRFGELRYGLLDIPLVPVILITSHESPVTIETDSITLEGTASEGVVEVTWAISEGSSGVCTGTQTWSAEIPIPPGENVITITGIDDLDASGTAEITVTLEANPSGESKGIKLVSGFPYFLPPFARY